jgi:hypothetical protein
MNESYKAGEVSFFFSGKRVPYELSIRDLLSTGFKLGSPLS